MILRFTFPPGAPPDDVDTLADRLVELARRAEGPQS
jgi:hypothetical protein